MRGAALIVLVWNQWPLTRRCLDSLLTSELDGAEVIVVDNGSTDDTRAALDEYTDRVRIVRLPENLGFVRGMNTGIRAARKEDDVVLLNNDLVFTQRDWLDRMRDTAYAAPDVGIVGCRMLGPEPDDRVHHLGSFIEPETLWGQQTESGQLELEIGQFTRTRRVQGIAFALAYIRRDCLDRIGLLDEAFHSYFEDTDYCLRAADVGIASIVAGEVTLRHDQHGSTRDDDGFRERLWKQSRATFAVRWQQRLTDVYRGTVLWQGVTRLPHAHAQLTHQLLWRLDARGLRMAYAAAVPELFDGQDYRLELAAGRTLPALPDVALICTPGTGVVANGRYRVVLAFSEWESLPAAWAAYYNTFDRIVVPDAFQATAFRRSGITTALDVLPLGVDIHYFHSAVPSVRNEHGRFVFLAVAEQLERDAPDQIVAAFRRTFHADDAVELLLVICPGNDEVVIRRVLMPLLGPLVGGRVRLMNGFGFPAYQRAQLLNAADVYVSARRGAGWDPYVREALACGRILVAPAYGSQQDLVGTWGHAIGMRGYAQDTRQPGSHWGEPDTDALELRLREVFAQREQLREQALDRVNVFAQTHNLDASADRLVELLAQGGTLREPAARPAPHRPLDNGARVSGQIVVLGMHRAGTSSVGGLLALFGAWPGPDALLLRGDDNPKGHYEHGELHMACLRRLAAAGGDWKRPPDTAPPAAIDAFRREVAAVLETLEPRRPWFIKEPRLCLLARELLPLLTHPVFVHVARDPLAVADSLARRDGMPADAALALWERYTRDAFAASAGWSRVLVDYDALLAEPVTTARRLHDDLAAAGVSGLRMPADDAILDWIEPVSAVHASREEDSLTARQIALRDSIRTGAILEAHAYDRDAT